MITKSLAPADFLLAHPERVILDVRTPAEYAFGHIPGARNLPLFSDEERAIVGTLYKQVSPHEAFLKGLDFAGARMRQYVESALALAPEKKVAIHCWRGGQRSSSMAWLLATAGFDVSLLRGGYKAYRRFILAELDARPQRLIIIGGKTGTGKTKILHALRDAGEQIIDLEALAHHKGSAFGAIGELAQPSFEQFSNNLYAAFAECQPQRIIWLESESKAIGKLQIPAEFWRHMCAAPMIEVQTSLEQRILHLLEIYAGFPREALADAFRKLTKRLGSQQVNAAIAALEADDYPAAARIALAYYDKAYTHSLLSMNHGQYHALLSEQFNPAAIAADLIALSQNQSLWNKLSN